MFSGNPSTASTASTDNRERLDLGTVAGSSSASSTLSHVIDDDKGPPHPPVPAPKVISRSLRACELCRKTKAKCCGNLPCKRCSRSRRTCVYSDGKLVAQKKTVEILEQELAFLKSRNEAMEELLHSVCTSPRSGLQGKMYASEASLMTNGNDGSIDAITHKQKSLSLSEELEEEEPLVKRLAWPPIPVADALINYYFSFIQPTFPFLWKPDISATYTSWSRNPLRLTTYDAGDHAIINMMFALSIIHSQALQIYSQWPQIDGEAFHSRAKALVPTANTLHPGSTIKEIQLKGLLGIYCVMHHHIDSAWAPIASAVRGSMNMGMHLNTEHPTLSTAQIEHRIRVWWGLISLERLLGDFTGRPSGIDPNVITCPLPSLLCESKFDLASPYPDPLNQRQLFQNPGPQENISNNTSDLETYAPFVHRIEMEVIAHRAIYEFQKVFLVKMTDTDLRTRVSNLNTNLSKALYKLPKFLDFTSDVNLAQDAVCPDVHRIILALTYHHTRMIIHRPYLLKPRTKEDAGASSLLSFELSAAYYCTSSAQAIVTLLPDDLELAGTVLFHVWWGYMNPICRAAAVLLMEVLFQSHGDISRCRQLLHMYQKAMKFLQSLSKSSEAALSAWETFDRTFNDIFLKVLKEVEKHKILIPMVETTCTLDGSGEYLELERENRESTRSLSFEKFCTQARQAFLPPTFDPLSTDMLDLQFSDNQYYSSQNGIWQQYMFPSMEEINSFSSGSMRQLSSANLFQ